MFKDGEFMLWKIENLNVKESEPLKFQFMQNTKMRNITSMVTCFDMSMELVVAGGSNLTFLIIKELKDGW